MAEARDYILAMPATTPPLPRTRWLPAPASLAERMEYLLWVPPESSITWEHEVVPDANVDLRPGALAEALHMSPRTLQRAFKERVGFSPGTYARITRFQAALSTLRQEPTRSLSEVAHQLGYADHAHMTREFRELTGRTPSDFRRSA